VLAATPACPVHVVGKRIVDAAGQTTYRYPGNFVPRVQIKCSRRVVWVLLHGGAASSQELYLGLHSVDRGRHWKLLLAEPYFGIHAPFTIDSYSGPWTIVGQNAAYFVGWCPACGSAPSYGTISLTVTLDGGRSFRHYRIPLLTGYMAKTIRVTGREVVVTAMRGTRTQAATVDMP
jgi:hypothetical protein